MLFHFDHSIQLYIKRGCKFRDEARVFFCARECIKLPCSWPSCMKLIRQHFASVCANLCGVTCVRHSRHFLGHFFAIGRRETCSVSIVGRVKSLQQDPTLQNLRILTRQLSTEYRKGFIFQQSLAMSSSEEKPTSTDEPG